MMADDYDDLEQTIEEQARTIAAQVQRIATLESENGRLTGQCDARGNMLRYVAFALSGNEMADAQEAADKAVSHIATLEAALRPFAAEAKLLPNHPDDAGVEWTRYLTMRLPNDLRAAAAALEGRT